MYHVKKYLENLERKRAYIDRKLKKNSLLLDRNEKFIPLNPKLKKKLLKKLSKINPGLYPDIGSFYKKISKWIGLSKENIFLTDGVSGAIKNIIECYALPGKSNIVFPFPTFAMYPVYCNMFNLKQHKINYTKNYKLNFQLLLKSINKKTAIVFLPNPNIPIEGMLSEEQIIKLINKCEKLKVILAIDEVYYPFGNYTSLHLIKKFKNLLIMRSFSKAFGLAGIRLGYILGSKKNINYISKIRTGYESNSFSLEIASFFINHEKEIFKYIKEVKYGFKYFKAQLNKLRIQHDGGNHGCFIYVNLSSKKFAALMVNKLRTKNIFVRGSWPKPYEKGILISGTTFQNFKRFSNEFFKIYNFYKKK